MKLRHYQQTRFTELTDFQRWYVRSEYKFLREMGLDRGIAKDTMFRTASHLYLATKFSI